ncbi:hypothetical protein CEY12_21660 [Chryseobacterium sp. T16E-39]|uniref:hypothetical protein n=1 Tax=Chryseobacterium sp. T16E-39 TaxID=2015076 RepID=UPI000B5B2F04|nr:hypothetical protein [Chryseobacterium sp. T16E-39]ASK32532.1 hypothetical protein CEY12_21660 [Chryseobacterium sp. T16E-39]
MKKTVLIFSLLTIALTNAKAQTIVVNPDGTHSTVIDTGATQTIVNPNGTHSTIVGTGMTKTVVNPDGTHSTLIDNGTTGTIVSPGETLSEEPKRKRKKVIKTTANKVLLKKEKDSLD